MPLNKRSMGHGKKNSAANTYTTGGTLGGDDILTGSLNDGQEWAADLSALSDVDEKVKISADDTTANFLLDKLVAGSNITLTETDPGGNETITIDAGGSTSPGGSDTYVQFNDGGSFGGSADFVWDGTNVGIGTTVPTATLDVSGSLVKKVKTVTNADDTFTTTDYHVHMINARDPGVTITGTLPTAVTGKEIIVTSFILPATVSGDNQIDIESAGGDTINNLTEITINTAPFGGSADNNYDTFIFRAIDENTWAGAKMEAVT